MLGGVHAQGAQGSGNEDSQHGHRQHQIPAGQAHARGTEPMAACTVALGR